MVVVEVLYWEGISLLASSLISKDSKVAREALEPRQVQTHFFYSTLAHAEHSPPPLATVSFATEQLSAINHNLKIIIFSLTLSIKKLAMVF